MKFNERLLELRNASGKSQKECAEEMGISNSKYNKWENGVNSPDYETLCFLARFYNTTTDYLLGITDIRTNDTNIKAVCDYCGLSETAVKMLNELKMEKANTMATITIIEEILKNSNNIYQLEVYVDAAALALSEYIDAVEGAVKAKKPINVMMEVIKRQARNEPISGLVSIPAQDAVTWYSDNAVKIVEKITRNAIAIELTNQKEFFYSGPSDGDTTLLEVLADVDFEDLNSLQNLSSFLENKIMHYEQKNGGEIDG